MDGLPRRSSRHACHGVLARLASGRERLLRVIPRDGGLDVHRLAGQGA
jgi:hypothetical protein